MNEPIPGKLYYLQTDFHPFLGHEKAVVMFLDWRINAKPRDIRSPDVSFAYPLNPGITAKVLYEGKVFNLLFYNTDVWPAFFTPVSNEPI